MEANHKFGSIATREAQTHIGIDASRAVTARRTGTEGYSYHLIRRLLAIESPHRFTLYFNRPPRQGVFDAPAAQTKPMPFPRLWTHARLSFEMARKAPDVLFVPAHVIPIIHPSRSVVTIHDVGYLFYRDAYPSARWLYLAISTLFSARVARRVIADSATTRDDLIKHLRIDPKKIDVAHLGVDPTFRPLPQSQVDSVLDRHGLARGYFVTVSTIHPRKNLGGLLRGFALARQQSDVRLAIVGQAGHRASEYRRLADDLGVASAIRWLGYVPGDDVPALLNGARALTYPSFHEGFGLPVLEAMACGTPVIASRTSSLPEVAGDAAILVDPNSSDEIASAMIRLANTPDLAADLARRGARRAATFTWERCARSTLSILEAAGSDPR
jgi:glycosyltransferase involved in cell wall biosynthesis